MGAESGGIEALSEQVQTNARTSDEVEEIALGRQLRDWRDHWSIEAEVRLRRACLSLSPEIDERITALSHKGLLMARSGFMQSVVMPRVAEVSTAEANSVIEEARTAFSALIAHHLEIAASVAEGYGARGVDTSRLLALGKGLAPLAAAVGLGALLPGFATTTTAAMFGLVTMTTVSIPVFAIGIGGVVVLGATGVLQVSKLRGGEERRLRQRIEDEIERRVFTEWNGNGGGDKGESQSLLAKLQQDFDSASRAVIGKL